MENLPKTHLEQSEAQAHLVEKIYQSALAQHEKFKEIPENELRSVIKSALEEINRLELVADPKKAKEALTPEIANNLSALWVFSGPGDYDNATKDDRYKAYHWAEWMDHDRLSYAGWLARISAELIAKGENPHGSIAESSKRKIEAREIILRNGPPIIYNGTEEENLVTKSVPAREGIIIPPEKVHIVGEGIKNTVDQVKTFRLPENLRRTDGEIGLVSHAPHLMRVLHMLRHYPEAIPDNMRLRLFPVASPTEGREEYTTMEIRGLLYYIYLSPNHDAEKESYPYVIHGQE